MNFELFAEYQNFESWFSKGDGRFGTRNVRLNARKWTQLILDVFTKNDSM